MIKRKIVFAIVRVKIGFYLCIKHLGGKTRGRRKIEKGQTIRFFVDITIRCNTVGALVIMCFVIFAADQK